MTDTQKQPSEYLADLCHDWLRENGRHEMPAPCPEAVAETVEWWLGIMTEPKKPNETPFRFGDRAGYALLQFLRLKPDERRTVVAGVCDDGVPYRGDSFEFYLRVWDESAEMKKNPAAYKARAIQALKQLITAKPKRRTEVKREAEEVA